MVLFTITESYSPAASYVATAALLETLTENLSSGDTESISAQFAQAIAEGFLAAELYDVFGWFAINDGQTPNWGSVNDANTATWTAASDAQTPAWSDVSDSQTTSWNNINDAGGSSWVPVNDAQ